MILFYLVNDMAGLEIMCFEFIKLLSGELQISTCERIDGDEHGRSQNRTQQ